MECPVPTPLVGVCVGASPSADSGRRPQQDSVPRSLGQNGRKQGQDSEADAGPAGQCQALGPLSPPATAGSWAGVGRGPSRARPAQPPPGGGGLTGAVVAIGGEGVQPPLLRSRVARDVRDRERLLSRTHPVVLVQFELFLLHLKHPARTVNWRFMGVSRRPRNARARPPTQRGLWHRGLWHHGLWHRGLPRLSPESSRPVGRWTEGRIGTHQGMGTRAGPPEAQAREGDLRGQPRPPRGRVLAEGRAQTRGTLGEGSGRGTAGAEAAEGAGH